MAHTGIIIESHVTCGCSQLGKQALRCHLNDRPGAFREAWLIMLLKGRLGYCSRAVSQEPRLSYHHLICTPNNAEQLHMVF